MGRRLCDGAAPHGGAVPGVSRHGVGFEQDTRSHWCCARQPVRAEIGAAVKRGECSSETLLDNRVC